MAERAFDAHGAFAMGASDFPALMAAEPPDRHTPITDLSYDDDEAEIANFDNGHPYLTDTEQQQPDSAFGSESDAAFAGEAAVLYDTPGPAVEAVLYDIVYSAEDGSALVLNDVLQVGWARGVVLGDWPAWTLMLHAAAGMRHGDTPKHTRGRQLSTRLLHG